MKKMFVINWLIVLCCFVFGITGISAFTNTHQFTVPSRGIQYYEVGVPENAKQIKAIISGQTEMVNLSLYAPGENAPSSKNSTWSNLSNWKKAFQCSVNKPKPGIWRVKVEGAVHTGKAKKIKSVSGLLDIYVDGVSANYTPLTQTAINSPSYPIVKEYQFTVPSRGIQYYEVGVPENAKQIKAIISGQTEMVSLSLYAPGENAPSSKNSTWSNLSNWKKAFQCTVNKPKPGIWRVKVEGAVHTGKADKIKSVSGLLKIFVGGVS